jgi:hypothetical protein
MIFQAGEQLESLETIDAQLPEEIIVGGERTLRHVEVLRSQVENFLRGLFEGAHAGLNLSSSRQEGKLKRRQK